MVNHGWNKIPSSHELLKELEVNLFLSGRVNFVNRLFFYRDIFIHSKKYYKIKDFNAIVDFILQEKLLVSTLDPLPVIDMNQVESYALQVIEQGPLNYNG